MRRYNDNGVAEVWLLRIRVGTISCYRRVEGALRPVVDNSSVLLGGVRFDVGPDGSIVPLFADGEEFPSHFVVILARAHRAEARLAEAEANAVQAEAQAAHAEAQAAAAIDTVEHLRAQLRAAGITPSA